MIAKLDYERMENGFARVKFMADVPYTGNLELCITLCSSIVHEKLGRWCRAWSPDKTCGFDAVPRLQQISNKVICTLYAVVPMAAVNDCRRELTLG